MGVLRLLLAFSVVAGHGYFYASPLFINPAHAVVLFFVVSGFYMAFVINETYRHLPNWRARFLGNRALRLYPGYFAALLLEVAIQIWFDGSTRLLTYGNNVWEKLLVLPNFTIIGQDVIMLAREHGYVDIPNPILIQPAWSVACELMFYVVAAYLFMSRRGLAAALLLAAFLHYFLWQPPTWDIKFAPSVFTFFVLGAGGYLVYQVSRTWPMQLQAIFAIAVAALIVSMFADPAKDLRQMAVVVALGAPFLFQVTRTSSIDRLLGDLSYPVYLVHGQTYRIAAEGFEHGEGFKAFMLVLTLVISLVIVLLVERPLMAWRDRIAGRAEPAPTASIVSCMAAKTDGCWPIPEHHTVTSRDPLAAK